MSYEEAAKSILFHLPRSVRGPETKGAIMNWRQGEYFGSVTPLYPQQPEIVLVTKTSKPAERELVMALKRYRPETLNLAVDEDVDFEGVLKQLRLSENRLTHMTNEQIQYILKHQLSAEGILERLV